MRDTIKRCAAEIKKRWPKLHVTILQGYADNYDGLHLSRWGTRLLVHDKHYPSPLFHRPLLDHHNIGKARVADVRRWIETRTRIHGIDR